MTRRQRADLQRALRIARRLMAPASPFLEGPFQAGVDLQRRVVRAHQRPAPGVYPVLRYGRLAEELDRMGEARRAGRRRTWEDAREYVNIWRAKPGEYHGLPQ